MGCPMLLPAPPRLPCSQFDTLRWAPGPRPEPRGSPRSGKSTGIMLREVWKRRASLKELVSETPSCSSPAPVSGCAEFPQCLQTAVTSFWTG